MEDVVHQVGELVELGAGNEKKIGFDWTVSLEFVSWIILLLVDKSCQSVYGANVNTMHIW